MDEDLANGKEICRNFFDWIKAVPKSKFPTKPGEKNGWAVPN